MNGSRNRGPRDGRFGRNFAHPFETPLTVWVGKFFKSWVQGSLSKGRRIPSCRYQEGIVLKLLLSGFLASRSAATAVEYGLVMAGIALAILASQRGVGTSISGIFTTLSSSLK
jgi:pilus assembly protein Flp/PilA